MQARKPERRRYRPIGATLIALSQAVLALAVALSWRLPIDLSPDPGDTQGYGLGSRIAVTAIGLIIAAGLWRLKRWAWVAVMLWVGVSMTSALVAYANGEPRYPVMALSVLIVFYLNQRDIQQAFRGGRGVPRAEGRDE
jgi:hypothetical protein